MIQSIGFVEVICFTFPRASFITKPLFGEYVVCLSHQTSRSKKIDLMIAACYFILSHPPWKRYIFVVEPPKMTQ